MLDSLLHKWPNDETMSAECFRECLGLPAVATTPNQGRPCNKVRQLLRAQHIFDDDTSNILMTTFFLYRQTIRTVAYTRTYHDLLEIHSSVRRGRACIVTYLFTSDLPRSHRDTIVGSSRSSIYRYLFISDLPRYLNRRFVEAEHMRSTFKRSVFYIVFQIRTRRPMRVRRWWVLFEEAAQSCNRHFLFSLVVLLHRRD